MDGKLSNVHVSPLLCLFWIFFSSLCLHLITSISPWFVKLIFFPRFLWMFRMKLNMLTTHTLNTLKGFLSFKRGCFLFVFLNHVIGKTENQILHKLVRFCTSPPPPPTCTPTASKQTTVNVQRSPVPREKCIYLFLKEMATSWSIWLYGAIIIITIYFSRITC